MESAIEILETPVMKIEHQPVVVRRYQCRCGRPIFFRNSVCLACRAPLGYEPHLANLFALDPAGDDGTWTLSGPAGQSGKIYRRCANLDSPAGCNWLVKVFPDDDQRLCECCRLNRTIPDLSDPYNASGWQKIEVAKRRLVSSLIALGLPVKSRVAEDPQCGLAFDFLRSPLNGPPVMTGHEDGIITLNIDEADDIIRERNRQSLRESYRTLLGHLRHEVGHYYWDRLIADTRRLDTCRELFGDEREDYNTALQRYYSEGAPRDWSERYVSAYASSHPWEDWAESWSHYLHITDTWDTALSFGLGVHVDMDFEGFTREALYEPGQKGSGRFLRFLNSWTELTAVLNELSRAMGLSDFYPFVLSKPVVAKLHFIHTTIAEEAA